MITTGFETRVKVQQIIENQLPEFILSESPKAVDFLKQYYISQEYQGGPTDISENLDQYLKVDNLTPEIIVGFTSLTSAVSSSGTTISVNSTKGFPEKYGLLKINNEVITYTGLTTNTFTGCIRGFSGITTYRSENNPQELEFSTSSSDSHISGTRVENLSSLFLKEFYNKLKYSLTPGLENVDFVSNLNVGNFIKEARTFYEAKGTEESFRILFNVLFGSTPKVIDLEQFLLKPSFANFLRRELIVIEAISGDPNKLVGQTIIRSKDSETNASVSEVEIFTRTPKVGYAQTYYKIGLFVGFSEDDLINGTFEVTPNTKVLKTVSVGSSIISVDSTIGFGQTGTLVSSGNVITYSDKSINQFFDCLGVDSQIPTASDVRSDDIYYGYENGDLDKKVEFRITGSLSSFVPTSDIISAVEGEKIYVKNVGEKIKNPAGDKTYKEIFFNSWVYNTSSRYEIETISGSTFTLKSNIDKASLKVGDFVDILGSNSNNVVVSSATVSSIDQNLKQVILNNLGGFTPGVDLSYDLIRNNNYASSSGAVINGGNDKILSDVQNSYNDADEYFYVASNSLPSYQISEDVLYSQINAAVAGSTVQGYDASTGTYSIISFGSNVPFITGDKVYYKPGGSPIQGLSEGTYYVKVVGSGNQIRLYSSRSFIDIDDYLTFYPTASGDGYHKFTLDSQKDSLIGPRKLLRKFPSQSNILNSESTETTVGSVGMLINGVEIVNYKSDDKVYYGPLTDLKVLNIGSNYDVINPPSVQVSSPSVGTTALIQPVVSGSVQSVVVDPSEFDIANVISISITGGNGSGAVLEPVLSKRYREISFNAQDILSSGGLDYNNETITFLINHNLQDGEKIVYNKNGNDEIGIGTFGGSNTSQNKTLVNGSIYYPKIINNKTVKLFETEKDYFSGINTVGFTTIANQGIHKFRVFEGKNNISKIKVINPGDGYTHRQLKVKTSGISTSESIVIFSNHNFKNGEIVNYSTSGTTISGLSTSNQYYIITEKSDTFRLADAGVGGTITSNYERKKYVKFESTGSGYQIFSYPEVSLSINVSYGSSIAGIITATPVIRGKIIDAYLYENGTGYGSTTLNLHKKPIITVKTGKNAELTPVITDGRIEKVVILSSGSEYNAAPDLVVNGNGNGAVLRAVVTNGSVTDVIVINSGAGYTKEKTTVIANAPGSGVLFDISVRNLTLDNQNRFGNEILVQNEGSLEYGIVGYSTQIGKSIAGDDGNQHSPIVGWAYDGNPIYGPYGYSDSENQNSYLKLVESGYTLDINSVINRPPGFASGFFVEDYRYDGLGDLDEHNGRYGKTPEFPQGVYAYFCGIKTDTFTSSLISEFPYFIGNSFKSKFYSENKTLDQTFDFNSSNLVRNSFPYNVGESHADNDFILESYEISNQQTNVDSVSVGSVDSFTIVSPGEDYKVGDVANFNNEGTNGGGLTVSVSSLVGKNIVDLATSIETYEGSLLTWKTPSEVEVKISPYHDLLDNDYVVLSGLTTNINRLSRSHQIGVITEYSSLLAEVPSNAISGVVTDIYLTRNFETVSVGSTIGIGTEILSVLNIFNQEKVLRVKRGLVGSAHTASTIVNISPDKFIVPVSVEYFDSKVDDKVYFNPKSSVGVGTTAGIGVAVNFKLGEVTKVISVPTQSIYLPNHPFENNQEVTFNKKSSSSAILVSTTSSGTPFNLPSTGNSQTLYVISKSKDFIGLVTSVGLTTNTDGLFFTDNGTDNHEYYLESNYDQITAKVEKIKTTVSVSTSHELKVGDTVTLNITPSTTVGVGTSTAVRVKYNSSIEKLLINRVGFGSQAVNNLTDKINIQNHGYRTGDKVFYDASDLISAGLQTGKYFVYRIDNNSFQLSETYTDITSIPPVIVSIAGTGGANQEFSLVNPKIESIRGNNLKFDLSDSSLQGYDFKIFTDQNFRNEFISVGNTAPFSITGVGTIGVSTIASLTINYDANIPPKLYYNVEKSGFISTSDTEVNNYSEISFVNSKYNSSYSVIGIGTTTFNISLPRNPERLDYSPSNCETIEYTTISTNAKGGVDKLRILSGGSNYKLVPSFTNITSEEGKNASIIASSKTIGRIKNTTILDQGFEYSVDRTLKPEAYISPRITLKDSGEISKIDIISGGKNYTSPPDVVVINGVTREKINSGSLLANITSSSITSIDIVRTPKGLSYVNNEIFTENNTNGVGINTLSSSSSGIVTCFLVTPVLGYTTPPFTVGDKIYVEGIQNNDFSGTGFNSSDNGYVFFTVDSFTNSNPAVLQFSVSGVTTNPGLAKTIQSSYATIIKYSDYPQFEVTTDYSQFAFGEALLSKLDENDLYSVKDLNVTESNDDALKVVGTYVLSEGEIILGQKSGSVATIESVSKNSGVFSIGYSLQKNYSWSNDTGKLDVDYQVLPDNDYYQNLSYTVKSPITYEELVNPVNRLVHTVGLKNFADTEIQTETSVGSGLTAVENTTIVRDILEEKRVDTINFYDNVVDIDTITNSPVKSKFLKLNSKTLADYIQCNTNRVLKIDDFSSQFRNNSNITENYVDIVSYDNTFSEFLIQTIDPNGDQRQLTELLVLNSGSDAVTIQKSSLYNTENEIADIEANLDEFGNLSLRFYPEDVSNTDYDIKVLSTEFNSLLSGIGTQSVGFINMIGANKLVGIGSTEVVIGFSTLTTSSIYANFQVYDQTRDKFNFVELEIDHDGQDVYISEFYSDGNQGSVGGQIGTFGININSGVLALDFSNNSDAPLLVRGNIIGFGSTSVGVGTYRFKTSSQPDGSERSVRIESNYYVASSTSTIISLDRDLVSSVKSLVRVSYGDTTSIHQIMMIHDGTDVYIRQYPFISVGSTGGIGTFFGAYSGSNLVLSFYPDPSIVGNYTIESLDKIFYTDTDTVNNPPTLIYGTITQDVNLAFYNAPNNERSNKLDFDATYNGTPIFAKTFNPTDSAILNPSTGVFTIENHFFSTGEKLNYTPESTVIGVAASAVGIGSTATAVTSGGVGVGTTNILPSTVYAIKINNDQFKLATTSQYANLSIGVTFTSTGSGNAHELEMYKRMEKTVLSVDGIIQYPLSYSPVSYSIVGNGGQISAAATYFAVSGISSIKPADLLEIENEFVKVIAVGFATTAIGPIDGVGITTIVEVKRGAVGTSATTHADSTSFQVYRGSYNVVGSKIYFTEPPRGSSDNSINSSNLQEAFSSFNGRVFLKQDYTNNIIYDDISDQFTGIGQTFTLKVSGVNTSGISTGSGILLINDIFQTPTTLNNAGNNYELTEGVGVSTVTFTGITSSNGSIIISPTYINQNQLPRGGTIISLGSTNGLGYAPLVGAAVTAVIGVGGSITAVGIGSTDISGSGYRGSVSIAVTSNTGHGAIVSAVVGAGGSLSFVVTSGGTGYAVTNTIVRTPDPIYENLPIVGVSRLGIGSTTQSGTGLLLNVEVGASSTTGIGSTLFEVTSFKVTRPGYGFRNGDVFKPVGLITARGLAAPVSEFELTVIETFSDSFAAWQFGELDYIDSIESLQNGVRTRFPLNYNGQLLSFQTNPQNVDSAEIDLNTLLLIFVNGVVQDPGVHYNFTGGTSFTFAEPPESSDNISIFFYRGTRDVDSIIVNVNETIKSGDTVRVIKNNLISGTKTQDPRIVVGITSSDVLETNLYGGDGIDEVNYKPMSWTKQKVDRFISGEFISKSRDSIEAQIYPTAKIIKNVSSSDTQVFVDDAQFFNYEENESAIVISSFNALIIDTKDPVSAAVTAIVSAAGTIQSLNIVSAGAGYTGSSIEVKIAAPKYIGVGFGTTATATIPVVNGSLSGTANITNPGLGYSLTNQPKVIVPLPGPTYETVTPITTVEGFSGIITGITTSTGTSGNPLALKFFLRATSFIGLSPNYPICVVDTKVGNGVTSIDGNDTSVVGVGTTFLDNIYYVHSITSSGANAEVITNIKSNSSIVGIATTGSLSLPLGRFSWGRFSGLSRSSSAISIGVTGLTVDAGLTTFPTIQRRGYGLRDTGSLRKDL